MRPKAEGRCAPIKVAEGHETEGRCSPMKVAEGQDQMQMAEHQVQGNLRAEPPDIISFRSFPFFRFLGPSPW
jgi:hypothetical protein